MSVITVLSRAHLALVLVIIVVASIAPVRHATAQTTLPAIHVRESADAAPGSADTLPLRVRSTTGSRLGLTIQQLPASIDLLGSRAIEQRGFRTITEVVNGAVGVTAGMAGAAPANFSMRGFSSQQVTVLYDGLRIGPTAMTTRQGDTWILDRVEVLKGAASVLYGEGAVGGAINFVPRRATGDRVVTDGMLSYGSFNTVRAGLGAGGPIDRGARRRFRIDGSTQRGDGWLRGTDAQYDAASASLAVDPHRTLSVLASADWSRDEARPYWGTPLLGATVATEPLAGVVRTTDGRVIDERTRTLNYNIDDATANSRVLFGRVRADWRPGRGVSVRNEAYRYDGDREWRNAESYTFDAATSRVKRDRFFVAHDQRIVGDRLDVAWAGTVGGFENRVVIGLDVSSLDFIRPGGAPAGDTVNPLAPDANAPFGTPTLARRTADMGTTAAFVENALHVGRRVTVIGGLRRDAIDLDRKNYTAAGDLVVATSFAREFTPLTWRLGAVVQPSDRTSLYAQYATSADPVGSNVLLANATQNFDMTTGGQAEIGVKHATAGGMAELTAAVFAIARRNLLTAVSPTVVENVGRQSSRGVEAQVALHPSGPLRVVVNGSLLRARFDRFAEGAAVRDGNRPPNVPNVVANAFVTYRLPRIPVEAGAALRYVGSQYNDNANTIQMLAYHTTDLHATWRAREVTVTTRLRNAFDRRYAAWGDPAYSGQLLLGAPRSVEAVLTWHR